MDQVKVFRREIKEMGIESVICHNRCDPTLYAYDSIVNQAAKWRFQTGN
jgi:hypothetical protein